MGNLDGKVVVITGASSGIGAGLAKELVRRGARVGLLARREDKLRQLAEELNEASSQSAAWRTGDVCDDDGLAAALDGLEDELGRVDVMVANAGYGVSESPRRHEPGASIRLYDTNLLGMLRCIDWALPRFVERGDGHIVGVASVASYAGMPYNASYCGSKAAMRIHLQSLRVTLKRYGVAATCICPGFVESELTETVQYPMPFFWPTDRAARRMVDAIEKREAEVIFPWQMKVLTSIGLRLLPRALFEYFMTPKGKRRSVETSA